MEKFIPYEKLSKKEKRKMDLAKRQKSQWKLHKNTRNWISRDTHASNTGLCVGYRLCCFQAFW